MILGAYAIIAIVVAVLMYYEDVGDLYLYDDSHWLVRMGVHALSAICAAAVGVMWPLFAVIGVGAGAISGIAWLIDRHVREEASDGGEVRERVEETLSEWKDLIGDSVESWGAVLPPSPAEIADRILALRSGSDSPQEEGATCYDCGRRYGNEFGFPDLIVPDDVWEQIIPTGHEGGLLCPSCLVKRCVDRGIVCEAQWTSGPFATERKDDAERIPKGLHWLAGEMYEIARRAQGSGYTERAKAYLEASDMVDAYARRLAALLSAPSGVEEPDESEIPVRCTCEWESPMTGDVDTCWPHVLDPYCRVHGAPGGNPEPCRCVPVEGEPTGCYDCGRRYGDAHGFPDLLIPDWAWERIMPGRNGGGLLCPSCIAQRCVAAGLSSVPAMWASGPLMGEPYRDGDGGGRDWFRQPAPKGAGTSVEGEDDSDLVDVMCGYCEWQGKMKALDLLDHPCPKCGKYGDLAIIRATRLTPGGSDADE